MSLARARLLLLGACFVVLVVAGLRLFAREEPGSEPAPAGAAGEGARLRVPAAREVALAPAESVIPPSVPEASKSPASLAAESDDPRVVEAAFASVLSTHAARSTKKPGSSPELERAIVKHAGSERASTALAALEAARVPLMSAEPSAAVTRALVELAEPGRPPARRYAALTTLNLLRPDRRDETALGAFERALDADRPELVSFALLALSQSRASVEAASEAVRSKLGARVTALLGHYDPGVRGHALLVLSEIPALAAPDARYGAARRASTEREPFVRARAAELFARCADPAAIHVLIAHVRDLAPARYELRGFTELDGSAGTLVHEVPGQKRVADAVLFALFSLGEPLAGKAPFALTLAARPVPDAVVLENAGRAEAWYREVEARIPRVPVQAR